MAYIDVCRLTEDQARIILESIRWPDGIKCPKCDSENITKLKTVIARDGLIQCNTCRKQFTVTVGTVMEDSHITLRQWLQAFHSMSAHKKGVSALQLQRDLGLKAYPSAWHLAHRIREAMKCDPIAGALGGIVEVDETYVGGKPRKGDDKPRKRGRGTKKAPVMLMVEREGKAVSKPVESIDGHTLKTAIRETVDKESTIMTDELTSYSGIGNDFTGGHKTVNHSEGQYVNGDASTNTAESYFALLKRGVYGTFHHISKKHLGRYCNEFSFRWDNRGTSDGQRAENVVKGIVGKKLSYDNLVKKYV
ncbi:MAG: IS1595 family transposase [Nitrospirae bacterium]|nr:IS1595 family transposase [Nitrospirota bacterium]